MPRVEVDVDVDMDMFSNEEILSEALSLLAKMTHKQKRKWMHQFNSVFYGKTKHPNTLMDVMKRELLDRVEQEYTYQQLEQMFEPWPKHIYNTKNQTA